MIEKIRTFLGKRTKDQRSYEGLVDKLKGTALICDARVGSYLVKQGYDIMSLLDQGIFSACYSLVTHNVPEAVRVTVASKMQVIEVPEGQSFGNAVKSLARSCNGEAITVLGRISPYTRAALNSCGINVITLEFSESRGSCTDLQKGIVDVRDVIDKYDRRGDQ